MMPEPPPNHHVTSGNGTRIGIVGGLTNIGLDTIGKLPAGFLALILLNTAFIGGLLWFLDKENAQRERVWTPVLTACIAHMKQF